MKVFVLHIEHKHGDNIYVCAFNDLTPDEKGNFAREKEMWRLV